jgi:hypothetical protein
MLLRIPYAKIPLDKTLVQNRVMNVSQSEKTHFRNSHGYVPELQYRFSDGPGN